MHFQELGPLPPNRANSAASRHRRTKATARFSIRIRVRTLSLSSESGAHAVLHRNLFAGARRAVSGLDDLQHVERIL